MNYLYTVAGKFYFSQSEQQDRELVAAWPREPEDMPESAKALLRAAYGGNEADL